MSIAWWEARKTQWEEAAGVEELSAPVTSGGPAGLLDPRRQVVEFVGRNDELTKLIAWCETADEDVGRVRLVTGPGGVGKTRLAVQLRVRLAEVGWRCVLVGEGQEATAVSRARAASSDRLLLVVDYAETRTALGALLREVAAASGMVRVLLLARSAGEWWELLGTGDAGVRALLRDAYDGVPLSALVADEVSDAELVEAAIPRFAVKLGVEPPEQVVVDGGGHGRARILDLHAAALVAVLRSRQIRDAGGQFTGPVRVQVAEVLGELLEHEDRFWLGSALRAGLLEGADGLTPAILRRIVAAGCLLGAASEAEAMRLLDRVPGAAASGKVAYWLRDLYPPHGDSAAGEPEWLGTLQPDRLAEHHTIAQLSASPELTAACLTGLSDRQALRAVTLLGRASTDQPTAEPLLRFVLPLVERVLAGLPPDVGLLSAISAAIPYPSLTLAAAHAVINRRILDELPSSHSPERARWLDTLGVTLSQLGSLDEALLVAQEAVATYRELTQSHRDMQFPRLASSLSNLGATLSALKRLDEALTVTQEAVEVTRELMRDYPDEFRPQLALALTNLGVAFSRLERLDEALTVTQEAVEVTRELARSQPDQYRLDLAASLTGLGKRLILLGHPGDALQVEMEAITIRQELALHDPDRYRPDLILSLTNHGMTLSALGRPDEALTVTQEAVEIARELVRDYPDRYRPDLASALTNLGVRFSDLRQPGKALPIEKEAVAIRRELARTYPDRHYSDLAKSLFNLGVTLYELRRPDRALPVMQEVTEIYRELVATSPDRYRTDLAHSLNNLAMAFDRLGRDPDARQARAEALTYRSVN
ncbi:tetratricopeptide repeat protein [Streptosporangium subroseum]|uniref:tetratricopeptide repeat protein n=1 Tax=Streptosporangium subroseum TaxID=106412 RepID=UPI00308E0E57|nr:tetratricopeptide repeat protein [Streptosporangium subroseum]